MTIATINLVRNDNLPEVTLTLTDNATKLPIDLSASTTTVVVRLRAVGGVTVLATLNCTKPNGGADGKVSFFFPGTTLDLEAGVYEGEIEISFNGLKQTIFDLLRFRLRDDFEN